MDNAYSLGDSPVVTAGLVAGNATFMAIESLDDSESASESEGDDNDHESVPDGGPRFEDCSAKGCHESLISSEMPYHIDLHAVLDYQDVIANDGHAVSKDDMLQAEPEKYVDVASASGTKAGSVPVTAAAKSVSVKEIKSQSRARSPEFSSSDVRSSSAPPGQERPLLYRSSPKLSSGSSKSARIWKNTSNVENLKPAAQHKNGCEHRRHQERGRERGQTVAGEVGLSTPVVQKNSRQAFLSRKPSKRIRSFLALFTGPDSKRAPLTASSEDGNWEKKESIKIAAGRRHRSPPGAKGTAPNTVRVVSEGPKRLGKAELGKYADEERMPDWLAVYLKQEWGVVQTGKQELLFYRTTLCGD
ncbi:hypothetical protein SEPCBS57363_000861 [Sporothrix epigloea]|uniref:Uncharacterized protein n=1 Tax=Sporothrix epigloea TaxID=1892477 RepID=A0ABP0D752_9PEZI